jgi:hypothetical protein
MGKPNYRVTKTDGETGARSTVGRHVTGKAAQASRLARRSGLELGSSDSFGVTEIHHRGRKGSR